jgi:hypothetical protein
MKCLGETCFLAELDNSAYHIALIDEMAFLV